MIIIHVQNGQIIPRGLLAFHATDAGGNILGIPKLTFNGDVIQVQGEHVVIMIRIRLIREDDCVGFVWQSCRPEY